jgi:4-hydroxy-4-methyl-2-oxoglutarate aldolase
MVPLDMTVTVHSKQASTATTHEIERWRKIPTAIIADVSDGACLIDPAIRPLLPPGQQPRLFGFAVTAVCQPPDFGAVLHALDIIEHGDVLVIAAGGHRGHAMIGEILGGHLRRKGAAGIVCDGAVRDVAELAGWNDLPVFTRHITPRGPTGAQLGEVNGPAVIGGRRIASGDLIIGDDDGLVSLNALMIPALIEKAEAKLAMEVKWQASLAAGKSIQETFGL